MSKPCKLKKSKDLKKKDSVVKEISQQWQNNMTTLKLMKIQFSISKSNSLQEGLVSVLKGTQLEEDLLIGKIPLTSMQTIHSNMMRNIRGTKTITDGEKGPI